MLLHGGFPTVREQLWNGAAEPAIAKSDPRASEEIAALVERIDLPYTLGNLSDLLARSRDGLKRIQQIVQDLREFSRHDAADGMPEEADVNAGIRSTTNIVRAQARGRGVELELDLAPLPGRRTPPAWPSPAGSAAG